MNIFDNLKRGKLIQEALINKEAITLKCGALSTWSPKSSTGRNPKCTYIVKDSITANTVDWSHNNDISKPIFDQIFDDYSKIINNTDKQYIINRCIGAETKYALPTKVITDRAISALFVDNMFRPIPKDIHKSVFYENGFTLLVINKNELNRYPTIENNEMFIGMDMTDRKGIIIGSLYCGTIKKLLFTVINYLLPDFNVLPLHCSANIDKKGTNLFLGLSGTGKTTLSSDNNKLLIGDDEHGWSETCISNFENGCYAKLINLDKDKEPHIYNAAFHKDDIYSHGSIVENLMVYPDGSFDLDDNRLTDNSRASYPLRSLKNIKPDSKGGIPKTIIFLTADAYGVLPPISKLSSKQAMLWFLMGYTSKIPGTETGIKEPIATFSRFFGEPFMPRLPEIYTGLFGDKIKDTAVYLINTGWIGGPYGIGERIDINITREMVDAAIDGSLEDIEYDRNVLFHLNIPRTCMDISPDILNPRNMWRDKNRYDDTARDLANKFSEYYDRNFSSLPKEIRDVCPGK